MNFTKPAAVSAHGLGSLDPAALGRPCLLGSAVVALLLSFMATGASGAIATSGWPDYGGGYLNQHRSPYLSFGANPAILWSFDLAAIPTPGLKSGFNQPILLPDATVVFNTFDNLSSNVTVALRPNGTLRWYT